MEGFRKFLDAIQIVSKRFRGFRGHSKGMQGVSVGTPESSGGFMCVSGNFKGFQGVFRDVSRGTQEFHGVTGRFQNHLRDFRWFSRTF